MTFYTRHSQGLVPRLFPRGSTLLEVPRARKTRQRCLCRVIPLMLPWSCDWTPACLDVTLFLISNTTCILGVVMDSGEPAMAAALARKLLVGTWLMPPDWNFPFYSLILSVSHRTAIFSEHPKLAVCSSSLFSPLPPVAFHDSLGHYYVVSRWLSS